MSEEMMSREHVDSDHQRRCLYLTYGVYQDIFL